MSVETPAQAAATVVAPTASRGRERLSSVLWPLGGFASLLLAWQILARAFGVPEYILPVPT